MSRARVVFVSGLAFGWLWGVWGLLLVWVVAGAALPAMRVPRQIEVGEHRLHLVTPEALRLTRRQRAAR